MMLERTVANPLSFSENHEYKWLKKNDLICQYSKNMKTESKRMYKQNLYIKKDFLT